MNGVGRTEIIPRILATDSVVQLAWVPLQVRSKHSLHFLLLSSLTSLADCPVSIYKVQQTPA
jgi:uncharacterized membrane protein YhfC